MCVVVVDQEKCAYLARVYESVSTEAAGSFAADVVGRKRWTKILERGGGSRIDRARGASKCVGVREGEGGIINISWWWLAVSASEVGVCSRNKQQCVYSPRRYRHGGGGRPTEARRRGECFPFSFLHCRKCLITFCLHDYDRDQGEANCGRKCPPAGL